MGVVEMRGIDGCYSEAHKVDASRFAQDGGTNATIFVERDFTVNLGAALRAAEGAVDVAPPCRLLLQVLDETSTGGHHFKIRDLVLSVNKGSPCQGASQVSKLFLELRAGKKCPDT
eukprot:4112365-Prymnesium_polylepis.1